MELKKKQVINIAKISNFILCFILCFIFPISCISQKKNLKTEDYLSLNSSINESLIFKFNVRNISQKNIYYYKCFSLQQIELNKNLLFTFSLVNRIENKTYMTKNFINYNTKDCLKKIEAYKTDSLSFDLKLFFNNTENINFKENDILVEVFMVFMDDQTKKTITENFIINPYNKK